MHSLFGVALHLARVLGAALVESTEQGPQGAKAPTGRAWACRQTIRGADNCIMLLVLRTVLNYCSGITGN